MAELTPPAPAAGPAAGGDTPAFGQATLSNCEREPIHLAGAIQPQGLLLLLQDDDALTVLQASANAAAMLGAPAGPAQDPLQGRPLATLPGGPALAAAVQARQPAAALAPQCFHLDRGDGTPWDAALHRPPGGGWVLELLDTRSATGPALAGEAGAARLAKALADDLAAAATLDELAEVVVQTARRLTGHDRVMVYRFDADGHGSVIAEARRDDLPPLLGHHYPASDIPPQARALYLRQRVRVLADVDDVQQPLEPALRPDSGTPLDMSDCQLRSLSPVHLQYLRNMGVTATATASLVRDGRLWGLIAAHHHTPRPLGLAARAALGLLGELASTRIAAIENNAHAQVALLVRRLEQRLVEATGAEGDWRQALVRDPGALLQPTQASGAALFIQGELLTVGATPPGPVLQAFNDWLDRQAPGPDEDLDAPFAHGAVTRLPGAPPGMAPLACGVLAVRLSREPGERLMWFRGERVLDLTWAGDPNKPMEGDDPLHLSPRRSFQAWVETVRGTAPPWSVAERVFARALGRTLADLIGQVHAVRLLIAEHQLARMRRTVQEARGPVLVTTAEGRLLFSNPAFDALRTPAPPLDRDADATACFTDPARVQRVLAALDPVWRGEWALRVPGSDPVPVAVRAERIRGRGAEVLGCILALDDLRDLRRTAQARQALEEALQALSGGVAPASLSDPALSAILTATDVAALDVADAAGGASVVPLLQALEDGARRAQALYAQLRGMDDAAG